MTVSVPASARARLWQSGQNRSPEAEATVDQFREYLKLSGVGEIWRATWIAALDPNWKRVAAPYWPASLEDDMRNEMQNTDLAPAVWSVYHSYFSQHRMSEVNALLRYKGVQGYLASPVGRDFCREWALHEDEGHQEIQRLTLEVLTTVYERDKPAVKAARARYMKEHPDYKD
jgi:hypothetical protein